MNIDEMSDQDKSVLLARAMGWETRPYDNGTDWFRPTKEHEFIYDLYAVNEQTGDPLYMALAWRVLNWACEIALDDKAGIKPGYTLEDIVGDTVCHPLDDAQRAWLDKILELLAIGDGLVEADHV